MAVSTTKMSSKGQVVIPESIRERLGLQAGARFVVVADQDAILLKLVTQPSMEEFDELLAEARRQARRTGLKQSDIGDAVAAARREPDRRSRHRRQPVEHPRQAFDQIQG